MLAEGFMCNRHRELTRFEGLFPHHKCVFAHQGFRREANELHNDLFAYSWVCRTVTSAHRFKAAEKMCPCWKERREPTVQRARFDARGRLRSRPVGPWGPWSRRIQPLGLRSAICIPPIESRRNGRKRPRRTAAG